jgi:hypothetical protein
MQMDLRIKTRAEDTAIATGAYSGCRSNIFQNL